MIFYTTRALGTTFTDEEHEPLLHVDRVRHDASSWVTGPQVRADRVQHRHVSDTGFVQAIIMQRVRVDVCY